MERKLLFFRRVQESEQAIPLTPGGRTQCPVAVRGDRVHARHGAVCVVGEGAARVRGDDDRFLGQVAIHPEAGERVHPILFGDPGDADASDHSDRDPEGQGEAGGPGDPAPGSAGPFQNPPGPEDCGEQQSGDTREQEAQIQERVAASVKTVEQEVSAEPREEQRAPRPGNRFLERGGDGCQERKRRQCAQQPAPVRNETGCKVCRGERLQKTRAHIAARRGVPVGVLVEEGEARREGQSSQTEQGEARGADGNREEQRHGEQRIGRPNEHGDSERRPRCERPRRVPPRPQGAQDRREGPEGCNGVAHGLDRLEREGGPGGQQRRRSGRFRPGEGQLPSDGVDQREAEDRGKGAHEERPAAGAENAHRRGLVSGKADGVQGRRSARRLPQNESQGKEDGRKIVGQPEQIQAVCALHEGTVEDSASRVRVRGTVRPADRVRRALQQEKPVGSERQEDRPGPDLRERARTRCGGDPLRELRTDDSPPRDRCQPL